MTVTQRSCVGHPAIVRYATIINVKLQTVKTKTLIGGKINFTTYKKKKKQLGLRELLNMAQALRRPAPSNFVFLCGGGGSGDLRLDS